jgi:uncharacterized protein (TIGR02145 family)
MKTRENILRTSVLHRIKWIAIFFIALTACQTTEEEVEPEVRTDLVAYISEACYEVSCKVISMGVDEISEHGVCWSESENPGIDDATVCLGSRSATGSFKCLITELSPDTRYYFRAFVQVNSRVYYGDELTFRTYGKDVLVDINGNIYQTVPIGDQVWMAENLKVTRYADGTPIPFIDNLDSWFHLTRECKAYSWYEERASNGFTYGGLYTWAASVGGLEVSDRNPSGIQGVCPDGWHVPSDDEWKQLERYLGMDIFEANAEGWRGEDEGGALKQKGTGYWAKPNTGANNETGFNALPGGFRHGSGEFYGQTTSARFWTTSKKGYDYGIYRQLDYDKSSINRSYAGVYRGHSVRCIKDR